MYANYNVKKRKPATLMLFIIATLGELAVIGCLPILINIEFLFIVNKVLDRRLNKEKSNSQTHNINTY